MASRPSWPVRLRALLSRWRTALRASRPPRRLRFTREGKIFVGVTIGVGFAAVNTGNNLLYLVLGLLLSLVILSGVLSEIALRGLEFRRRLPKRAYAGTASLIEVEVYNKKRYAPSYSIEVEDRIEGRRTDKRCYFLKVSAGARQTAAYRRIAPVRGVERYLSLRVATRFPFGLFEKWREIDMIEEQVVYPSPLRGRNHAPPIPTAGELVTREERGQGEVDGVREIGEGDPVRDVHWPKTAALDRVIARERRREGARAVRIEVANKISDGAGATEAKARVEDDIRRAAFVALQALRDGAVVHVIAEVARGEMPTTCTAKPSSQGHDRVLAYLALLPPDPVLPEDAIDLSVRRGA